MSFFKIHSCGKKRIIKVFENLRPIMPFEILNQNKMGCEIILEEQESQDGPHKGLLQQ